MFGSVVMSKKGKWFSEMIQLTSECKRFKECLDELREESN